MSQSEEDRRSDLLPFEQWKAKVTSHGKLLISAWAIDGWGEWRMMDVELVPSAARDGVKRAPAGD